MTPQTKLIEDEGTEEIRLQEESLREVEDHSLSAQDVLTEQQKSAPEQAPSLFVP